MDYSISHCTIYSNRFNSNRGHTLVTGDQSIDRIGEYEYNNFNLKAILCVSGHRRAYHQSSVRKYFIALNTKITAMASMW